MPFQVIQSDNYYCCSLTQFQLYSSTAKQYMHNTESLRGQTQYGNPIIQKLVNQLKKSCAGEQMRVVNRIRSDRKMRCSLELANNRQHLFQNRPSFNNKTSTGEFLDKEVRSVPYVFIPAFKNQTFIMPDRVFARGKAAKRAHQGQRFIIILLQWPGATDVKQHIEKAGKIKNYPQSQNERVRSSTKTNMQIFNVDDGRKKSEINKRNSQISRYFRPPNKSGELLSTYSPLLQPRESELNLTRKISLNKTFDNRKKWHSTSKYSQMFNSSLSRTNCIHQRNVSSIL